MARYLFNGVARDGNGKVMASATYYGWDKIKGLLG